MQAVVGLPRTGTLVTGRFRVPSPTRRLLRPSQQRHQQHDAYTEQQAAAPLKRDQQDQDGDEEQRDAHSLEPHLDDHRIIPRLPGLSIQPLRQLLTHVVERTTL